MSSSASRGGGGERTAHQDFIARIRFSNALPPPPNPTKLLDIPNTGLAGGQYTTPGFASRLAREQPLNIEVDAELGMPLDLVGMPGIFDGDESSIQAPSVKPIVHPHDQPLLKPLATLGKPRVSETHVSFLRRTEYISSVAPKHRIDGGALRASPSNALRRAEKRKSPEPDAGTPAYVKRKLEKDFAVTQAVLKDRNRVQHPTKKKLRLAAAYPLLPDLDGFPDSGAYVTVKFTTNPVSSANHYDRRLLSGILVPTHPSSAEEEANQAALEAHELDPERNPKPINAMNYQYFLPDTAATAEAFRAKFDIGNPDRDAEALYTARGEPDGDGDAGLANFNFDRVRAYETAEERELSHATKYTDEIVLSIVSDGNVAGGRAALYYPVMQRSIIRSQRGKNIARTTGMGAADEEEEEQAAVDCLEITVADPTDEIVAETARIRADPLRWNEGAEGEEGQTQDDGAALEEQLNGRASESDGRSPAPNGKGGYRPAASDEEADAEGEEEE